MFPSKLVVAAVLLTAGAVAQNPPQPTLPPPTAGRLQLSYVVQEALARNPAIQSSALMTEAQKHRVPQARALPDPTLTVAWAGDPAPFKVQEGDPSSYRGVSAMQTFPWPGKRARRAAVAEKDVAIADADYQRARRAVIAEASAAYSDYFYFGKALEIIATSKAHLQQFADISEARYRVAKAMQQDVLRAQVELSLLLQRGATLEQQREIAAARLNTLMGRRPDAPLPPAAELPRGALPNFDSLLAQADLSPDVLREQRTIERNQAAVEVARTEYRPDISVGYMYQQRPLLPDMYGMTFTVNLPIFYRGKQQEALKQAQAEVAAAESSRDDRRNQVRFELQQSYVAAQSAQRLIGVYEKAVLPQTLLALESSQASYQVGGVDFLTMLSNFTTLNSYQLDYYRQIADYEIALARIQAITGVDLTGAVAAAGKEAQ